MARGGWLVMGKVWARRATSEPKLAAGAHFRRGKSFIDRSATDKIRAEHQYQSVAIELYQPRVADPKVMRDLMEHDVPDLAA